jgi:hypothetical protein
MLLSPTRIIHIGLYELLFPMLFACLGFQPLYEDSFPAFLDCLGLHRLFETFSHTFLDWFGFHQLNVFPLFFLYVICMRSYFRKIN